MTRILIVILCLLSLGSLAAQEEGYPTPPEVVEVKNGLVERIDGPHEIRSSIFPGTVRQYWVSVPAAYDPAKPPCLMVVQDGYCKAHGWRLPIVLDNMIHSGEKPV